MIYFVWYQALCFDTNTQTDRYWLVHNGPTNILNPLLLYSVAILYVLCPSHFECMEGQFPALGFVPEHMDYSSPIKR